MRGSVSQGGGTGKSKLCQFDRRPEVGENPLANLTAVWHCEAPVRASDPSIWV